MNKEQEAKLQEPFTAAEIDWRVIRTTKDKTKGQVAAYVDSRAIQNRLDSVVGKDNWQNDFITVSGADNNATAHICKLSIYYPERGEWIVKSDGAGCTDIEPIKGGLSNAFKRAASMWGMGRYLYELKNIWVMLDEYKCIAKHEKPNLDSIYNEFLAKLLKSSAKGAQKDSAQQTAPTVRKPNTVPSADSKPKPNGEVPAGRFAGNSAPKPSGFDFYNITELKVMKDNSQTKVTMQSPDGEVIVGYMKGVPELRKGQTISKPKIVVKNAPGIGNYNIIQGYDLAA